MKDDVFIIEYYIKEGKTQLEIAKILEVTSSTIINRLRKKYVRESFQQIRKALTGNRLTINSQQVRSAISRRTKRKKIINKDILISLIKKDLYQEDICKILKVTEPTLNNFIKANYNFTFKYLREQITGRKVTKNTIKKLQNNIFYTTTSLKGIDIIGKLYLLKVSSEDEVFYKIGVTKTSINTRYKNSSLHKNYKINILEEVEGNLYDMFQVEQLLKKLYSLYKYIPKYRFDGCTECFSIFIPLKII